MQTAIDPVPRAVKRSGMPAPPLDEAVIGRRQRASRESLGVSGVELEQQDIAILDHIFLAFVARLAGFLGRHFAA